MYRKPFKIFVPVFFILKIMGVSSFTLRKNGKEQYHAKVTKKDVCLFIIFITGAMLLVVYTMTEHVKTITREDLLSSYVETFNLSMTACITIYGIFCGLVKYKVRSIALDNSRKFLNWRDW